MKIFVVAILLLLLAWTVNFFGYDDWSGISRHQPSPQMAALAKAGTECVAISEQATAHFMPKLEFQRLELAGRKANVVVRCMADRHYHQNPAWLTYAEPEARKITLDTNISYDEALENLKRVDMLIFEPQQNKPIFWQYQKAFATGR